MDALADAENDFEAAKPSSSSQQTHHSNSHSHSHSHYNQSSIIDDATRGKVRAKLEAALERADGNAAAAQEKKGDGGGEEERRTKEEEDSRAARLRRSEIAASVEAEAASGSTSRSVYFSKVSNAVRRLAASSAPPLLPTPKG